MNDHARKMSLMFLFLGMAPKELHRLATTVWWFLMLPSTQQPACLKHWHSLSSAAVWKLSPTTLVNWPKLFAVSDAINYGIYKSEHSTAAVHCWCWIDVCMFVDLSILYCLVCLIDGFRSDLEQLYVKLRFCLNRWQGGLRQTTIPVPKNVPKHCPKGGWHIRECPLSFI